MDKKVGILITSHPGHLRHGILELCLERAKAFGGPTVLAWDNTGFGHDGLTSGWAEVVVSGRDRRHILNWQRKHGGEYLGIRAGVGKLKAMGVRDVLKICGDMTMVADIRAKVEALYKEFEIYLAANRATRWYVWPDKNRRFGTKAFFGEVKATNRLANARPMISEDRGNPDHLIETAYMNDCGKMGFEYQLKPVAWWQEYLRI